MTEDGCLSLRVSLWAGHLSRVYPAFSPSAGWPVLENGWTIHPCPWFINAYSKPGWADMDLNCNQTAKLYTNKTVIVYIYQKAFFLTFCPFFQVKQIHSRLCKMKFFRSQKILKDLMQRLKNAWKSFVRKPMTYKPAKVESTWGLPPLDLSLLESLHSGTLLELLTLLEYGTSAPAVVEVET